MIIGLDESNEDRELLCRFSFPSFGYIGYVYIDGRLAGTVASFDAPSIIFKTEQRFKFSRTEFTLV